jgi:uncharacterized membrane-anchored protein
MIKLIWRFALLTAVAAGFAWLADRPGIIMLRWLGREIEMPLYIAVAALLGSLLILWLVLALLSRLFRAPGAMGEYFRFRRMRASPPDTPTLRDARSPTSRWFASSMRNQHSCAAIAPP